MLTRLIDRGLLWPGVATLVAFAMLMSLGTWQMQRKAWKEHLLAQIAERTHAPPVPLAHVQSLLTASMPEPYDPEYTHVSLTGRFDHDKEQYLWYPDKDLGPGYHVFTPLLVQSGNVVWINRGFVPEALRDPARRPEGQVPADVTVTGLYRQPPKAAGAFVPANDTAKRTYYWRSLNDMQAAAFAGSNVTALPLFVDADATPANPGGWPKGGVTLVDLPNRHLEYAITWFGLAATLLAVFAAFVVGRMRPRNAGDAT
jgi:surfeit locus 1 family protein